MYQKLLDRLEEYENKHPIENDNELLAALEIIYEEEKIKPFKDLDTNVIKGILEYRDIILSDAARKLLLKRLLPD